MELRFWGVRGSIPAPGPTTLAVGGNTTCVSLRQDDYLCVFDGGTGLRLLGEYLEDDERSKWHGSMFFTHYHWDHIQGLPFFRPAFREDNRFHLYGPEKQGADLFEILREQMQEPYFPVPLESLEGLVTFKALKEGEEVRVTPDITVRTVPLRHPNGAIGYRAEGPGGSVCIITDHEHPEDGLDDAVVEFARGATVLIHDAQYTPEEKKGPKAGWGHSSWEEAALTARVADVGTLFLSHHEPTRHDTQVFDILSKARKVFPRSEIATEATILDLSELIRASDA